MDKLDLVYEIVKKIEEKQDFHTEQLYGLTVDVARNTEDIKYHIKRTNMLEELMEKNAKEIVRVEAPQIFLRTVFKLVLGLGSLAAALGAIYAIYRFF